MHHSREAGGEVCAQSEAFSAAVDSATGRLTSLHVKDLGCDLVEEKRLAANFRILMPLPDYQCHYIEGEEQTPVSVTAVDGGIDVVYRGLRSDRGEYPIDLNCRIRLDADAIRFQATLTNHSPWPVAEFWYPRIGGWKRFGQGRDAALAVPGYKRCKQDTLLSRRHPGIRGLGAEAAEYAVSYPRMTMPWWHIHDAGSGLGLYLGYHDPVYRFSTWHTYLHPTATGRPDDAWLSDEEAVGEPVGLTFSHVRYPYVHSGEILDSGEFILRLHGGDWRKGARFYRDWFVEHFPVDPEPSWLRREGAWFSSIIYQPEDRIVADYETYDRWCREAQGFGIRCFELIGWDRGGLERDYPDYVPEEKLGGREGFKKLLKSIEDRGGKCLVFVNYNVLDSNSEWYEQELHRHAQVDAFGNVLNWMAWGESTLTARLGLSVRRHVVASLTPPLENILNEKFTDLVRDGARGFQIDKMVVGSILDFHPQNTLKPDTALFEGLVRAVARTLERCRAIDPDFRAASEAVQDRLLPYFEVYYRASQDFDIAPLRLAFPEWTSCQHVSAPADFNGVNGAILTGSVLCVEPDFYQSSLGHPLFKTLGDYIREVLRIREELADILFLGDYFDTAEAHIREVGSTAVGGGALVYRVHGPRNSPRRALAVANPTREERSYHWEFACGGEAEADLYEPFQPPRRVSNREPLRLRGQGLHILVERPRPEDPDRVFYARLGIAGDEVVRADDGYGLVVTQGRRRAWEDGWTAPVYHCRAHDDEIRLVLKVPKGARGTLRLYTIDPDAPAGGRRQEVWIGDRSQGETTDFRAGRWLECPVPDESAETGRLTVRVVNRNPAASCVLSLVEIRAAR